MIAAAFAPFLKEAPLCVMTRLTLESLFLPDRLDALFRETAQRQYQKELLFSELVELMMSVVLRVDPSVHAAYKKRSDLLSVSDQAIYDKLQCMELSVSGALVEDSATRLAPVIDALDARSPDWVRGFRTRIIDGNHLSKTERRIKGLRSTWAAALPGTVLAVYEPATDLVTKVCLTPDGHAQERASSDDILALVKPRDLWIADRNFCTQKLLFGIHAQGAAFVIRQHAKLPFRLLGKRRWRGNSPTGQVFEQEMELEYEGQTLRVRRVTVKLDQPTTDGDTEIHVVTNLTEKQADALSVAEIYRKRWTIEGRFYEVTQTLNCEPNTLGYPKAALFAFCLALVASNAVALLRASLRTVHDVGAVEEMSRYYVALEVSGAYVGMMIALPPARWTSFRKLDAAALAAVLQEVAEYVQPIKYRKARRGPKKPPTPKGKYENGGHVSTHKILQKKLE
jgi:hypothetical protein